MKRILIWFLLAVGIAYAQQQQPVSVQQPDCVIFFSISATGNSGQMNNRTLGCQRWTVAYTSSGFSAETVTFQSAPDSSGSPGTWVTFAGSTTSGSNPMTAITQVQSTFQGYYPWLRVNVSGLTGSGTISGTFYGFRNLPSGTVTVPTPLPVDGPDAAGSPSTAPPVQVAGNDGTNVRAIKTDTSGDVLTATVDPAGAAVFPCNAQAAIVFTAASGSLQIVGLTSTQVIHVCHISLASDTVTDITLQYGTGSNCGTGTTSISGAFKNVTSMVLPLGFDAQLKTAASNAFCINSSATATIGGLLVYSKYTP